MKHMEFTISKTRHLDLIKKELGEFKERTGFVYEEKVNDGVLTVKFDLDSAYTQFVLTWPRGPSWIVPKLVREW